MADLYRIADFRRKKRLVCFSRQELNALLSVYSRRVIAGVWKAYAIDHDAGLAAFSIFAHARAQPLYRVMKLSKGTRTARRCARFVVFRGESRIAQSDNLAAALAVFERELRLVSP